MPAALPPLSAGAALTFRLHRRRGPVGGSIEIWTDVKGVMTTDPGSVPTPRIDEMSFAEASEMAYFGAKVLHPSTLIPAVEKNIPVCVLDSRHPEGQGTCIRAQAPPCETTFRAIAAKKNIVIIKPADEHSREPLLRSSCSKYSSATTCRPIWSRPPKQAFPSPWTRPDW